MIDTLPPVVVFATPEGMLLADGYHRVAAARLRGLETVESELVTKLEPLWLGMRATVEIVPVMTADDLRAGLQRL
jgi:ParB-like chromosome segregation protein Spo0J